MTDSSTGGYLLPTTEPISGQALDRIFHDLIVGVSGIEPIGSLQSKCVPMWQINLSNVPDRADDWVAFGVMERATPAATVDLVVENTGYQLNRDEIIKLSVVFYGDNCHQLASRLRDGIHIVQNRDALRSYDMDFREASPITSAPELINNLYCNKCIMDLYFSRRLCYNYNILDYASAEIALKTEAETINIEV